MKTPNSKLEYCENVFVDISCDKKFFI